MHALLSRVVITMWIDLPLFDLPDILFKFRHRVSYATTIVTLSSHQMLMSL